MADRYWVKPFPGGTGDWGDTANWSATSGGATGASVPTSSDDVFIDNNSSSGLGGWSIEIDISTFHAPCKSFSANVTTSGASVTVVISGSLDVYGSFSNTTVKTQISVQNQIFFKSTSSGNTIDVVSGSMGFFETTGSLRFDGVGGVWTWVRDIVPTGLSQPTSVLLLHGSIILESAQSFSWGNFVADGSGTNQLSLSASTPGSAAILSTGVTQSANFTGTPLSGVSPLEVAFTDTSKMAEFSYMTVTDINNTSANTFNVYPGGVDGGGNTAWAFTAPSLTYLWDFKNDGLNTSTLANPYFIYSPAGTFTPKLDVTKGTVTKSITRSNYITVTAHPLTYLQTVYMVGAATNGTVQTINIGKSDDSVPIYYELETQELEFGNRMHLKKIADQIAVFTQFGDTSSLSSSTDSEDYQPIRMGLNNRVNIGKDLNLEGHYFTFKWFGQAAETTPVFEGIYIENVTDKGMTQP